MVCWRAPGKSEIASRRFPSSEANASKFSFEESTKAASCLSFAPRAVTSSWKLWMTRLMFLRRLISRFVMIAPSREVGSKRLNVSRRSCATGCVNWLSGWSRKAVPPAFSRICR